MISVKDKPQIWSAWDIGKFFGDGKASGYVTVEPNWKLNPVTAEGAFPPAGQTYRWFQSQSGVERIEVEVPNIKSIQIDRSLDTDAASCTIEIYNQLMDNTGVAPRLAKQLGNPGWYSPSRGASAEAKARWNQQPGESPWSMVNSSNSAFVPGQALAPMALVRSYEGFGAWSNGVALPWQTAVSSGKVAITGTWIVDVTTIGSDGILVLKCRDAAKLLIDQYCYPPLAPSGGQNPYPIKYNRWTYTNYDSEWDPTPTSNTATLESQVGLTYLQARTDYTVGAAAWTPTPGVVGPNYPVDGHYPSQSVDGDPGTLAMSGGYGGSGGAHWWEYTTFNLGAGLNQVYLHSWGGPYSVYISILEGNVWQGDWTIPIDISPDTRGPVNIPYVSSAGLGFETDEWILLPRLYNAQRVRITLTDSYLSAFDSFPWRSGLRQVAARSYVVATTITSGSTYAMATYPGGDGAWVISSTGSVFPVGDAPNLGASGRALSRTYDASGVVAAEELPVRHPIYGWGFWELLGSGHINANDGALHYGEPGLTNPAQWDFVDMAATNTGQGYWLLEKNGTVWAFGDAAHHGNMTTTAALTATYSSPTTRNGFIGAAIAGDPGGSGYWIVNRLGEVRNFGTADSMPNFPQALAGGTIPTQPPGAANFRDVVATNGGTGLWGLWDTGAVTTVGAAVNRGDAVAAYNPNESSTTNFWAMSKLPNDDGYRLLQTNGRINYIGGAQNFGDLGSTRARTVGNYTDYADIVKDVLLWSGFLLYGTQFVHGNIETTGAWSDEDLTEDIFDKKSIMDIITMIKEIIGWHFWIDDEGGVRFEAPNWLGPGNVFENGTRTSFVPTIDELSHLTSYSAQLDDSQIRSEVVIANSAPTNGNANTIVSTVTPPGAFSLRGMQKPALWFNEVFLKASEQQIMAELISMHIFFSMRQGSVQCTGNPAIQLNDQVRIYERVTADTYVHYVRAISTSHDFDSGVYKMTLGTNWLGDGGVWAITGGSGNGPITGGDPGGGLQPTEQSFAFAGGSRTFIVPTGVTSVTFEVAGAQGGDNAVGASGGRGCLVTGVLVVVPGETLMVNVGGQSGFNGGGIAGAVNPLGGPVRGSNGGGKSDIRRSASNAWTGVLVAAAGGGGAGGGGYYFGASGNGGYGGFGAGIAPVFHNGTPGNGFGSSGVNTGGVGATATAAGAGGPGIDQSGTAIVAYNGSPGVSQTGGNTVSVNSTSDVLSSAGGGGGGYFGGGGGGAGPNGGGGGGGSSFAIAAATNVAYTVAFRNGDGYIKFSWTNPIPITPPSSGGSIFQAEDAVISP